MTAITLPSSRPRAAYRTPLTWTAIAVLFLAVQSCSTLPPPTGNGLARPPSDEPLNLPDRAGEDINGNLPERIIIKTRTQSFNSYHQYAIRDGKIWYKTLDGRKGPADWRLFGKTGLPENDDKKDFATADRIVELSADADELVVLSGEGLFYRISFDKVYSRKDNYWFDAQGWPELTEMRLDGHTKGNLSWAVGKRNSHVLYYEDAFGNEHHFGTMGISSTYVLLGDGQEIVYEDTGLPTDFSRNIRGPDGGAFRALALSASASTVFLIGEAGEMYTRLADFDTIGSDPMFFKYTYEPYASDLKGSDYRSNFTPWGLPAEGWKKQPSLPLTGNARASRRITILQNGHGNRARELRVAGIDAEGNTGYWSKQLFAERWEFVPAELALSDNDLLDPRVVSAGTAKRGTGDGRKYTGRLWDGGVPLDEWRFVIPDFSILEGSCTLVASRGSESAEVILHPVEVWTFLKRDRPGRDGTPKPFFVTVEIPTDAVAGTSEGFREAFNALFANHHRKLFHFAMEATTDYILMEPKGNDPRVYHFLLTSGEDESLRPFAHSGAWENHLERFREFDSPELSLGNRRTLSGADLAALTSMIAKNERLERELSGRIAEFTRLRNTVGGSRVAYSTFHAFAHATQLFRLDFPKFYTLTRFGNEVFASNNETVNSVATSRIWLDEKLLELVRLRLEAYRDAAARLARGRENVTLPANYSDDLRGYWEIARLPMASSGRSSGAADGEAPFAATISGEPVLNGFPGWILELGGGACTFLVEAKNAASVISSRQGAPSTSRPLKMKGLVHLVAVDSSIEAKRAYDAFVDPYVIDGGMPCDIRWDGKTLRIDNRSRVFGTVTYYAGSASDQLQ